jgi:hypothetical protein
MRLSSADLRRDLRVERAQYILRGSGLDVDGAALRTLLRERLRRGVRELRANLRQ